MGLRAWRVGFIEDYLRALLVDYGYTHAEDDATGTLTSERLRRAETEIKRLVNAGPAYRIIETGSGATGAVHRLQQIVGLHIPATWDMIRNRPGPCPARARCDRRRRSR